MREIFSNNATGYLVKPLSSKDAAAYISPMAVFPKPKPGSEFFKITFVGSCNDSVEIAEVTEHCGTCLKLGRRGIDGTAVGAFSNGDLAYHSLTANSVQEIMDSYSFYLGAHCPAPTGTHKEGSFYYDLCADRFLFWNGEYWSATYQLAPTVTGQFTYIFDTPQNAGLLLPVVDAYGNEIPLLYADKHLPELFLNGVRLTEQIDSTILVGDYDIQWGTKNIKILDGFSASANQLAVIVVMLHLAAEKSLELGGAYSNDFTTAYNI